jgi:hypothetical protein
MILGQIPLVTLTKQNKPTSKTRGAHTKQYSLKFRFMTLGQVLFELRATQDENCKFLVSHGQLLLTN